MLLEITIFFFFVEFSKEFDIIHWEKTEQIALAYFSQRICYRYGDALYYKSAKVIELSPDSDTDFFDIIAGILQGNALALFLIICRNYVQWTSKDQMK